MVGADAPITVQIDQAALQRQISEAIDIANRKVSFKLREAADMLDPTFMPDHNRMILQDQRVRSQRQLTDVEVNRLAQYLYDAGGVLRIAMVEKPELVAALTASLQKLGVAIVDEEKEKD